MLFSMRIIFFFQLVDSQHFQTDKTVSNHCKSMAVWLVLSYLPCAFRSNHGYIDLCHIAGFIPLLLLTEILFLLKIFLSVVAPFSFQRVFFGATPLWRSSHPTAMRLPLFLVELPKPSLLPVASRRPSTGFTPGFPLRRPLYCCQAILAVYAAGDSLSLWNELFYCCQLVREISLKAEPESSPESDRLRVEASHHWAK